MYYLHFGWLRSVMVRAFDLQLRGREFDPRPWRYRVTALGKLLTPMCLCQQAVYFGTGRTPRQKIFEFFIWNGMLWWALCGIFVERCLRDIETMFAGQANELKQKWGKLHGNAWNKLNILLSQKNIFCYVQHTINGTHSVNAFRNESAHLHTICIAVAG